jgi:hypothetical protein
MYLGNQPALSYTSFAKQDFTTSATTSYTLDHPVANANELALFINFVRQEPTTSYTASGTTLTLTSATSVSDDMYCVFLGKAVQTVNPPSGSVGLSQLSATGTKDATTFLRGDNTFASAGGDNTPAFLIRQSSATSIPNATRTKVNLDTSDIDTDSGLDATNKRWIVPSGKGGKYQLFYQLRYETASDFDDCNVMIYKNGSAITSSWGSNRYYNSFGNAFIADLSVGDYLELFALQSSGGSVNASTSDFGLQTYLGGYKIIE